MELTRRVYRKLKLIYGNIARTLNLASFRRCASGLVERWVRFTPLYRRRQIRAIRELQDEMFKKMESDLRKRYSGRQKQQQ